MNNKPNNNPLNDLTSELVKIISALTNLIIALISKGTISLSNGINKKIGKEDNYEASVKDRFKKWKN